jgi:tetratricopeptide (TPR) repeat protein
VKQEKYKAVLPLANEFTKSFGKHAQTPNVWYFAGAAHYELKDYEAAITSLRQALDTYTGDWDYATPARVMLAESLQQTNQQKAAADMFSRLARNAQGDNRFYFLATAAELAEQSGNVDNAIEYYDTIVKQSTTLDTEYALSAAMRLTRLYIRQDQFNRVDQLLEGLIEKSPDEKQAALLLLAGFSHFKQERYDEAAVRLTRAAEQAGNNGLRVSQSEPGPADIRVRCAGQPSERGADALTGLRGPGLVGFTQVLGLVLELLEVGVGRKLSGSGGSRGRHGRTLS